MYAFWNENQMVECGQQQQKIYNSNFEIVRGKQLRIFYYLDIGDVLYFFFFWNGTPTTPKTARKN